MSNDNVSSRFSKASSTYEEHATLQREVARRLAASLKPWTLTLPSGPVLELGAGTGLFSRELAELLPERELVITDISDEMLDQNRQLYEERGQNSGKVAFRQMDAEAFQPGDEKFSLITGNFVAQWFRDPPLTLDRIAQALLPGGLMLLSFPGHESFPEWRKTCVDLGLPYTGNSLPDTEEMVYKLSFDGKQVDYYEDSYTVRFSSALDFFRHLKQIGSSPLHEKRLNPRQFRMLIDNWDRLTGKGHIEVTWHLVFLALKNDS